MSVHEDGDLTQDLCNLQDILLLPLLQRLQEEGATDDQMQDVANVFMQGTTRTVRLVCASAGIILDEDEEVAT